MNIADGMPAGQIRRLLPPLLGLALCGLLWNEARALDWPAVGVAFSQIPLWRWAAAALATTLSFAAIAQYDVLAHRHLRTGVPPRVARRAGAAAIAVGQTTGFGPAVGAALRWRLLPDLGHTTVIGLTGLVTLSFLAAWVLLTVTLALPVLAGLPWLTLPAFACGAAGLAAGLLWWPRVTLGRRVIALLSLRGMAAMTVLAGADIALAGLALALLLPAGVAPPLPVMLAAYALALGAGLMGGTPGGVGPFELTLLTVMPGTAAPDLAAALLAYRLIHYALPCLLGAGYALLAAPWHAAPGSSARLPRSGPRAELAIAAQSDTRGVFAGAACATALRSPHSLVLFLGPQTGRIEPLLPALKTAARDENRLPCLYKLTARDAARVRRAGWITAAFAVEAVIDPRRHDIDGPEHRQLRRFLRKARAGGVTARRLAVPDWAALQRIHAAWEAEHGPERGLTMGRYCPLYLADKPLYGAFQGDTLLAFTSWVEGPGVLSLDLMRHLPELPTGTMHALIQTVIDDARRARLNEVNLAALPHPALPAGLSETAGLLRFKSSFAPRWRPLYIAAPSAPALLVAAADIRIAIRRPPPLPRRTADLWHLDQLQDQPPAAAQLLHKAG
ncbi:phosphatidylglycerol lysyltransferase domain-containing protein [Maliponia aquimaris]|uniref:Lysyl-tRNA synthetase n=1 Tax=Maliponia aquimaris TaxID=1673631 RepID=A0A238L6X8_9RHOB|nr:phosphatidylglycerol lysyltransferase domain-containing protein [Maliponia aquimaris]SMX50844.1 lysyl-tRNA synthetase [Maliponia aquimaris]